MDFHAHATKKIIRNKLILIFAIAPAYAYASGDVTILYYTALTLMAFLWAAILILLRLKAKERIQSLCVMMICITLRVVIFMTVPYSNYEIYIETFSFINILVLFLFIFNKIKITKNKKPRIQERSATKMNPE